MADVRPIITFLLRLSMAGNLRQTAPGLHHLRLLPPAAQKHILPPSHARHRSIETADIQLFFNERRYLHHESAQVANISNMIFAAAEDDHLIDRNPTHSPRLKLTNAQRTVARNVERRCHGRHQDVLPKLENDLDKRYLACNVMALALRSAGTALGGCGPRNGLLHIRRTSSTHAQPAARQDA